MTPWVFAAAAAAAVAVAGLIFWQCRRSRHKKEQEQLDRILKENALDRALSNQLHQSAGTVAPAAVHYVQEPVTEKDTEILRLTLEEKSVSKSYLFRRNDRVYLGSANGQPTVFSSEVTNGLRTRLPNPMAIMSAPDAVPGRSGNHFRTAERMPFDPMPVANPHSTP